MSTKRFSNIVGFDDAPFKPDYSGPVKVVGTVFTGLQLTGVLMGEVEKTELTLRPGWPGWWPGRVLRSTCGW